MNSRFFILLFSLSVFINKAQVQEGMTMLGVSGAFYNNDGNNTVSQAVSNTDNTEQQIRGDLRFGYLITSHWALGLNAGYTRVKQTSAAYDNFGRLSNTQEMDQQLYALGVFTRYYKMFGEGRVGLFAHLKLNYLIGANTNNIYSATGLSSLNTLVQTDVIGLDAALVPGLVFFATKRIGIEASFGNFGFLRYVETEVSSSYNHVHTANVWNMNYGFSSAMLGVNFYFGGKPAPLH